MKKTLIAFLIMTVAAFSAYGASKKATEKEYKQKDVHKDLACIDCHGEQTSLDKYYLIPSESCLNCHGSREDVADLTKELDANDTNPHRSYHSGTATECYECHREHKPSRNYCSNCHDTDIWMKPVP